MPGNKVLECWGVRIDFTMECSVSDPTYRIPAFPAHSHILKKLLYKQKATITGRNISPFSLLLPVLLFCLQGISVLGTLPNWDPTSRSVKWCNSPFYLLSILWLYSHLSVCPVWILSLWCQGENTTATALVHKDCPVGAIDKIGIAGMLQ